jgi:hypothetical protein
MRVLIVEDEAELVPSLVNQVGVLGKACAGFAPLFAAS